MSSSGATVHREGEDFMSGSRSQDGGGETVCSAGAAVLMEGDWRAHGWFSQSGGTIYPGGGSYSYVTDRRGGAGNFL